MSRLLNVLALVVFAGCFQAVESLPRGGDGAVERPGVEILRPGMKEAPEVTAYGVPAPKDKEETDTDTDIDTDADADADTDADADADTDCDTDADADADVVNEPDGEECACRERCFEGCVPDCQFLCDPADTACLEACAPTCEASCAEFCANPV